MFVSYRSNCAFDENENLRDRWVVYLPRRRLLGADNATGDKGSNAPYNEGPVWTLTMIKTKAGLADDYLKQITGIVKPVYEEEKKQKIILDYKILDGEASGPQDFNILILVEYPNWAALDNLRDKMDPIVEKVMGTRSNVAPPL